MERQSLHVRRGYGLALIQWELICPKEKVLIRPPETSKSAFEPGKRDRKETVQVERILGSILVLMWLLTNPIIRGLKP